MKRLLLMLPLVCVLAFVACTPEDGASTPSNNNVQNQHCVPIVAPQE